MYMRSKASKYYKSENRKLLKELENIYIKGSQQFRLTTDI